MPHFIIHYSKDILTEVDSTTIMKTVFNSAKLSKLFQTKDIKVRVIGFEEYIVGEKNESFLHVFSHIMQGRTAGQKKTLSRLICKNLNSILPTAPIISVSVTDFEKESYCNKSMI